MEDDITTSEATRLEPLSREECLELLATASVGRVAVALPGGPPLVLPVNYALDGDVIVFRSDPGSKLEALREHPASFQVDCIDPLHRTGWSVLVQGFAYETSPAEVEVEPWDAGPKAHWVRIYAGGITGRRLTLPQVEPDPPRVPLMQVFQIARPGPTALLRLWQGSQAGHRPDRTRDPMSAADRSTWMEHLPTERCWELLASTPVGRLGVLVNSAPEIYPINHRVLDDSIVFRTDAGGKLHGLERSPAVCFEVDSFDSSHHEGWSVLVKGRAQLLFDPVDRRIAEALALTPWGLGPKSHWVRIVPAEVTGRRIHTSATVRSRTRRTP